MNLLDAALSLKEMEQLLAKELQNDKKDIRIIGDMELSCEDYKCLALKLKGMQQYGCHLDVLDDYKLCLIVTWAFALRYERESKIAYQNMKEMILGQPQYLVRKFLEICESAFMEYGIITFGISAKTLDGLCSLIAIHAGIPKQMLPALFAILSDSLRYSEMHILEQTLRNNMSDHMREVYRYVGEEYQKKMFQVTREMFIDCKLNQLPREELLLKYPYTSSQIMDACIQWTLAEEQEEHQVM